MTHQDIFVRRPGTGRRKNKPQRSYLDSAWHPEGVEQENCAPFGGLLEALAPGCPDQADEYAKPALAPIQGQRLQYQADPHVKLETTDKDTASFKDTAAPVKSGQRSRKMATVPGFGYGGVHLKGPCGNCGVPNSPQWRRGNEECPVLCNACGTWLKKNNTMRPLERIQLSMQPKRKKEVAAPSKPPKAAKKPRTAAPHSHRLSRQASAAAAAALVSVPSDLDAKMCAPEQQAQQEQELSSSSCSADLTHAPGMLLSDSSGSLDTSQMRPPAAAMAAAAAAAAHAAAAAAAGFCPPMPYGFAAGYLGHPMPIPGMFM